MSFSGVRHPPERETVEFVTAVLYAPKAYTEEGESNKLGSGPIEVCPASIRVRSVGPDSRNRRGQRDGFAE